MAQSDSFEVNNGSELNEQLGYQARSCVVDNFTSSWLYVPAARRYVPPGGGAGFSFDAAQQVAKIQWKTPPGKTPVAAIPTEVAEVVFSTDPTPAGTGITSATSVSSGPPTNIAQFGGGAVTLGQALKAASMPVVPASDFVQAVVTGNTGDSTMAAGTVLNPGAGAAIATIAAPGAGIYEVQLVTFCTGAAGTTNNMELRHGATTVKPSALSNVQGIPVQVTVQRLTVGAGEAISVNATAGDAGGATYVASIIATRVI